MWNISIVSEYRCTLTVAANGRDIITAVVEVVAPHITVATRLSLAVVSSTTSSIASCCTACSLGCGFVKAFLAPLWPLHFHYSGLPTHTLQQLHDSIKQITIKEWKRNDLCTAKDCFCLLVYPKSGNSIYMHSDLHCFLCPGSNRAIENALIIS